MNMSQILPKGKGIFLAYDHGMEHGPEDFNLINCDPEYIFKLGSELGFDAVITQAGIAEKYYPKYADKVKLIVKLNGKTRLGKKEPQSIANCSVKRAMSIGASAVGYTIYPGSPYEEMMFKELGRIVEEAHKLNLPVVVWSYPRGDNISENSTENIAYAARIALELGADIVKIKYNGDAEGLRWTVSNAGLTKVMIAGGDKKDDLGVLREAKEAVDAGAFGLAVGRNIWQSQHPIRLAKALKKIVYENSSLNEAKKEL